MPAAADIPGLFVSGTDTGVGKTLVSAALAHFLTLRGLRVGICKPVESGVNDPSRPGPDATLLSWAAECQAPMEDIAPYRLTQPLSPDQAAREDGARIDFSIIEEAICKIRSNCDFVIVEGAGGLMVPLVGGMLVADLAKHLTLPLLIVSRPDLGTINHTLLTTHAARTMGLELAGIILNRMPEAPSKAQENAPHAIASLSSASLLTTLPEVDGGPHEQVKRLAAELADSPTLPWLLSGIGVPTKSA